MIVVTSVLIACLWVLGLCLSLKIEASMCNQSTDYWMLLNPLAQLFWPIIAILYLRTKHPVRGISYTKELIQVHSEDWVY